MANENLVVARFFKHVVLNDAKTKAAGRPIYDESDHVEIRFAANKFTRHVAPAHEVFKTERNFQTGDVTQLTYALAYPNEFKKYKDGEDQTQAGTPLAELPFLTQSKRLELKALSIHTAETLAALDGPPLKQLGMGGRELKNQAQAYLDKAAGSVDVVKMAATITAMQAEIDRLKGVPSAEGPSDDETGNPNAASPFLDMGADDIKNLIESATGERPKGNPNHATLVKRADEINADLAKKAEKAA